jgi:hypothetical protein
MARVRLVYGKGVAMSKPQTHTLEFTRVSDDDGAGGFELFKGVGRHWCCSLSMEQWVGETETEI